MLILTFILFYIYSLYADIFCSIFSKNVTMQSLLKKDSNTDWKFNNNNNKITIIIINVLVYLYQ